MWSIPPSLITWIRYFLYNVHKKPRINFLLLSTKSVKKQLFNYCVKIKRRRKKKRRVEKKKCRIAKWWVPSAATPSTLTSFKDSRNCNAKNTLLILWMRDLGSSGFLAIFLPESNSKKSVNLIPSEKSTVMSSMCSLIFASTPFTQAVKAFW